MKSKRHKNNSEAVRKKPVVTKDTKKLELRKDQLLSEPNFISYCSEDPANVFMQSRLEITPQFLRAAEHDELLRPLATVEEEVAQQDGTNKVMPVNYYSPHQLFLVIALQKNVVDQDGKLRGDWHLNQNPSAGSRSFAWGPQGHGYNVASEYWKDEDEDQLDVHPFRIVRYFHNFLELLHSLEKKDHYLITDPQLRYFPDDSWRDHYDFAPVREGREGLLTKHNLDPKKLNILRRAVGHLAQIIDPLEHWHYYVQRHSKSHRTRLKGDAYLAEELYYLYDLITIAWRLTTGETPDPIFNFLDNTLLTSRSPFSPPGVKYWEGIDIRALQHTIVQYRLWISEEENEIFADENILNALIGIEKKLLEYEQLYGKNRSYYGSTRDRKGDKGLDYANLDDVTKKCVDEIQAQDADMDTTSVMSICVEKALWNLCRELSDALYPVKQKISERESTAWQAAQDVHGTTDWAPGIDFSKLSPREENKLWTREITRLNGIVLDWQARGRDFHARVTQFLHLVFCDNCRARAVPRRTEDTYNDLRQGMRPLICDVCRPEAMEKRQSLPAPFLCKGKGCRKKLFRFISENEIAHDDDFYPTKEEKKKLPKSHSAQRKFAHKNYVTLNYGSFSLKAICGYCDTENVYNSEYGWMP